MAVSTMVGTEKKAMQFGIFGFVERLLQRQKYQTCIAGNKLTRQFPR